MDANSSFMEKGEHTLGYSAIDSPSFLAHTEVHDRPLDHVEMLLATERLTADRRDTLPLLLGAHYSGVYIAHLVAKSMLGTEL
jgi:hypothetical protein